MTQKDIFDLKLISIYVLVDLYMQETIENLRIFEKDCTSMFVLREEAKEHNSLENRISNLENK